MSQQAYGSSATPELQRSSFMLAFAVRPLDLQDGVAGRDDV